MSLLGIHLTVLVGPTVAVPAPPPLLDALQSVEVTHSDTERSGFQIVFKVGRSGPADLFDYPLLTNPLLKPCNRIILIVTFNVMPRLLMDGLITRHELAPGNEPGTSTLTVTGEDLTVAMDLEERSAEHPAQDETIIANKLILSYPQYGLIPMVIPPPMVDPPIPVERAPVQQCSDLEYLNSMARRHGYVFYITPGPAPFTNTAYWGPPERLGLPQRALSVNMGPDSNVDSINFQNNALAPTLVSGQVQDRVTNRSMPVQSVLSTRTPLVSQPALLTQSCVRRQQSRETGLNTMQSFARAQGVTDASVDDVVTATGELDALRYGETLKPRALVCLRGAGFNYDGTYYVKQVTHKIRVGEYKQGFTLTREGTGALAPVCVP